MYEELFYKRLIKLRMERNISARDMSLSLGQNPGYINSLENGNGFPSMSTFFNICDYLKISPQEFFDESNSYPVEVREITEDLMSLDKEQLKSIAAIVRGLKK